MVIERYVALIRSNCLVVVSSGNHDLTGPDATGEQCALWIDHLRSPGVFVDGGSLLIGHLPITVFPWSDGDIGRAAVAEQLAAWIHEHQPYVVLTGHVHQSPFTPAGGWADRIGRTRLFNAGRQIGKDPGPRGDRPRRPHRAVGVDDGLGATVARRRRSRHVEGSPLTDARIETQPHRQRHHQRSRVHPEGAPRPLRTRHRLRTPTAVV